MSKESKIFLAELFANRPMPANGTMQQTRDAFEHWLAKHPSPSDVRFEPFSIGPLPACWAFARGVKRRPLILFFHGGGYTIGSVRSHWGIMGRLSLASGCSVLGINYRLAPENPYPAALEDAMTAYKWLLHHPYPPNHIVFAGCSAGAGLALALMLRLKLENLPLPAAGICISPWVDLAKTEYSDAEDILNPDRTNLSAKAYCGKHDLKEPYISPTYGDLEGLPPLLIHAGAEEILRDQIVEFAEKAKQSGVKVTFKEWADMFHTWHLFANRVPEGQKAIDEIGTYLKKLFQSQ